jgi:hypothetical protein
MPVVRLSSGVAAALGLALVAGCGGGSTVSSQPAATASSVATTGTVSTPAPTAVSATAAPVGSTPVSSTPVSSTPGTVASPPGGQGIADFCLNTTDEVGAALQTSVARAEGNENPGFGGGCLYFAADGALVYSIGFVPAVQGVDLIETGLQTPGSVEIMGIGERAVLMSAQGPLVYRKGTWNVTTGGTPDLAIASDAAAYRAAMEELARTGSSRF